jgi:cell division transport system permease protein
MIRRLLFFISEAYIAFRRSGIMIFIAVGTITVSLVVFGLVLLINVNMNNLAKFIASKIEIRVFLKEDLTMKEIASFQEEIRLIPEVKDVIYVPKEKAWGEFKEQYSNLNLTNLVDTNPLPNAFKVILTNNLTVKRIAAKLSFQNYYVADIVYGGIIAERMDRFATLVRIGGVILVGILSLATLFIIFNTIRLTVINRQNEITIMKLVGATNPFISGPFIIEGLIMGVFGSMLSVGLLKIVYHFFTVQIQKSIPYLPVVFNEATLNKIYFSILFLGALLGTLGALLSIKKSLKTAI